MWGINIINNIMNVFGRAITNLIAGIRYTGLSRDKKFRTDSNLPDSIYLFHFGYVLLFVYFII